MTTRLPKLVAFDLDYTLWDFWVDTHVHPPLRRHHVTGKVIDSQRNPKIIDFYRDVPQIMHRLQAAGVTIAACSRTYAPSLAREALDLILIPPRTGSDSSAKRIPAIKFFDQLEIYPSSKIRHFKKLHEKTGIPYDEMVSSLTLCMEVAVTHNWVAVLRRRMEESGSRGAWYVNLRTNETHLD
ncbi:acid phosphatase-domain-containing protein [Suillus spraguei]|nr:acid phosphatase-domain-containing protein [Suillus spraguei]